MADPDVVVVVPASDGGSAQPPATPPTQPPAPPPPGGFWSTLYRDLTLQRVALIVFAGLALAIILVTLLTLALEPNPKRVEQFQQVVIQFGCETERRTQWPGPKLPGAIMRDVGVAIQVT